MSNESPTSDPKVRETAWAAVLSAIHKVNAGRPHDEVCVFCGGTLIVEGMPPGRPFSSWVTDGKLLDCPECESDKDALVARVQPELSGILEHCFGESCGGSGSPSGPPPAEACEPFASESACGTASIMATNMSTGSYVDPGTAKLVKGSLWGFVAAGALTSGALFIANSTGAGRYIDDQGVPITNALWRPAWAVAGVTIGLIGLAIPITLSINKAAKNAPAAASSSQTSAPNDIQCPG